MKKKLLVIMLFVFASALSANAQISTRPKVAPSPTPTPTPKTESVDNSQVKDLKGVTQVAYAPKDGSANRFWRLLTN